MSRMPPIKPDELQDDQKQIHDQIKIAEDIQDKYSLSFHADQAIHRCTTKEGNMLTYLTFPNQVRLEGRLWCLSWPLSNPSSHSRSGRFFPHQSRSAPYNSRLTSLGP